MAKIVKTTTRQIFRLRGLHDYTDPAKIYLYF